MDTDVTLKVLFQKYASDLLGLTGDEGAAALSADAVELQAVKRAVDCVVKLRRGTEVYYRHIEFQARPAADMAERCFRYNSQLLLQLGAPVLTTVVYLFPPGPRESELVYRVVVGGKEINAWRFGVGRLWEVEAAEALASGAPGLLALVPMMSGGDRLEVIERAARSIERALPEERGSDAERILLLLAARRYTVEELARIIGRERMLDDILSESSIYQWMVAKGELKGKLNAERELCLELVKKHHPALVETAATAIAACEDPTRLKTWILSAGDLDDDAFARLLAATEEHT